VASVACSFLSVLATAISFNELEAGNANSAAVRPARCQAARTAAGGPFLAATLAFRAGCLAVLAVYAHWWTGTIIFGLFFANVLSALAVGDSFQRSVAYGCWSILVPVGFNRDPAASLGHGKVLLSSLRYQINYPC